MDIRKVRSCILFGIVLVVVIINIGVVHAALYQVSIDAFAFTPGNIAVETGDIVRWTNNHQGVPHTVTSSSAVFNSGTLNTGETFEFTFNSPGTFNYGCDFHPSMGGSVVVTNPVSPNGPSSNSPSNSGSGSSSSSILSTTGSFSLCPRSAQKVKSKLPIIRAIFDETVTVDSFSFKTLTATDVEDINLSIVSVSQDSRIFDFVPDTFLNQACFKFNIVAVDEFGNIVNKTQFHNLEISVIEGNLKNPPFGVSPVSNFDLELETDLRAVCRYSLLEPLAFGLMSPFNERTMTTKHTKSFSISRENQIRPMYVICNRSDGILNDGISLSDHEPLEFALMVDKTRPVINFIDIFPGSDNQVVEEVDPLETNIRVSTDDLVVCRYSETQTEFNSMENKFGSSDQKLVSGDGINSADYLRFNLDKFSPKNTVRISNLIDNQSFAYNIACKNQAGLVSDTKLYRFAVNLGAAEQIQVISPSESIAKVPVDFNITTNKRARCTFGDSSDTVSENSFIPGNPLISKSHGSKIVGIVSEGEYTFHINCFFTRSGKEKAITTSVKYDKTPPVVSNISGKETCRDNVVAAEWLAFDSLSDIDHFEYKLTSDQTGQKILVDISETDDANVEIDVGSLQTLSVASGNSAATVHNVEINNFKFNPQRLNIKKGDSVVWTNKDLAPHTVTSLNGKFDSGSLNTDQTFTFKFDDEGTFNYKCNFHPTMTGSVVVTDSNVAAVTTKVAKSYFIHVRGVDVASNIADTFSVSDSLRLSSSKSTVCLEKDKPKGSINSKIINGILHVSVNCTDIGSGCDPNSLFFGMSKTTLCQATSKFVGPVPITDSVLFCWKVKDLAGNTDEGSETIDISLDSDSDGVPDGLDVCPGTPQSEAINSQGCSDSQLDSDGDGIFDNLDQCDGSHPIEIDVDAAGCPLDSDDDGMPDYWEQKYGLDQFDPADASDDLDGDGFTNLEEFNAGTDPTQPDVTIEIADGDEDGIADSVDLCPDTPIDEVVDGKGCSESQLDSDDDGMLDSWEESNCGGIDACDPQGDPDLDSLTNLQEFQLKDSIWSASTDPLTADTDNDGYSDGDEHLIYETDPTDPDEFPESNLLFMILLIMGIVSLLGGVGYLGYKKYVLKQSLVSLEGKKQQSYAPISTPIQPVQQAVTMRSTKIHKAKSPVQIHGLTPYEKQQIEIQARKAERSLKLKQKHSSVFERFSKIGAQQQEELRKIMIPKKQKLKRILKKGGVSIKKKDSSSEFKKLKELNSVGSDFSKLAKLTAIKSSDLASLFDSRDKVKAKRVFKELSQINSGNKSTKRMAAFGELSSYTSKAKMKKDIFKDLPARLSAKSPGELESFEKLANLVGGVKLSDLKALGKLRSNKSVLKRISRFAKKGGPNEK